MSQKNHLPIKWVGGKGRLASTIISALAVPDDRWLFASTRVTL